ncbi:MAG: hypothetical protein KGL31_10835 [candidate division NC10 bacterium]|nr:hypothetical protein [candidate division NC10 bacterium]MDE2322388.1 hypothetical protein [candidate division NC10 bacterium]
MFKGAVTFVAAIKGNGLKFESFEFNPDEASVEKVDIVGQNGEEIRTTVYLSSVASHDEGRALAAKVTEKALDRMSIRHNLAIEKARMTEDQFSPLNSKPGVLEVAAGSVVCVGFAAKLVLGIPPAELKAELEKPSLPGEDYFGLFRSACQSTGPVEAFMHLYNILLMLRKDQAGVDAFIITKDPTVPQTPQPGKPKVTETVYTRLRNELGHHRAGVNLDNTKAEMATRLGGLMSLTAQAIQLCNSG